MSGTLAKSIRSLVVFSLLTGVVYPLAVTGIGQLFFAHQANGSLVEIDGKVVGSELLEQKFTKPGYFWGRPSGADYGTLPSGASNLGPTSQKLKDRVAASMKDLGVEPTSMNKPYDLLLASGSGLDPDLTPESAVFQAERVAKARGLAAAQIVQLIVDHAELPSLGLIGRPRVNVLKLNLALDRLQR